MLDTDISGMLNRMVIHEIVRPRLLPERAFPAYAYLSGRQPHPVRDPAGHSYQVKPVVVIAALDTEEFARGLDLFNHGYYWEAHEAWEGIWQNADRSSALRALLKGLILMSAAGLKIREGKRTAAMRHAGRAAALFRHRTIDPNDLFPRAIGMSLSLLADLAEARAEEGRVKDVGPDEGPTPVFDFILGPQKDSIQGRPTSK